MKSIRTGLGILISSFVLGGGAAAQDVLLRATDGSAEFPGELVDFNGTVYTIRTRLGTLNIPAAEVTCIGEGCPASNQVTSEFSIAGDRSILRGAMPELLDAYSLEVDTDIARDRTPEGALAFQLLSLDGEPVVNVQLSETTSDAAFAALSAGEAVLAVTSRQISDEEAAALTGRDRRALEALELEQVIGLDGLVAVVGADVDIDAISPEQIAGIYSGTITNWSELGGPDSPISAFTREPGSDVRSALERSVMVPNQRQIAANVIAVDSNDGVASAVRTFPNSIGITSFGAVSDGRMLSITDACGIEVAPNEFSIKSETYPLSVRIYLYERPGTIPVHARGFVDFASSDLGQQVVEDTGYLDLRPVTPVAGQGVASLMDIRSDSVSEAELSSINDLRAATEGAERLSSTFRVGEAGQLDGRARVDLTQIARMVRSGRFDGQELILVGFPGNAANGAESGSTLARHVVSRLFEFDQAVEEQITVGFRILGLPGPAVGSCNAAASERGRVEVWVRPL